MKRVSTSLAVYHNSLQPRRLFDSFQLEAAPIKCNSIPSLPPQSKRMKTFIFISAPLFFHVLFRLQKSRKQLNNLRNTQLLNQKSLENESAENDAPTCVLILYDMIRRNSSFHPASHLSKEEMHRNHNPDQLLRLYQPSSLIQFRLSPSRPVQLNRQHRQHL